MNKVIVGTKTMVVSPHYLASQAGERILEKGGNAFDAAVAVSACLAVVYPHMTGLGGDSFWLAYGAKEKKIRSYNGSGKSGAVVTRDKYKGRDSIPFRGIESVITVPGMVDSWDAILNEFGSMSLQEVLAPAIEYAKHGFPLSNDQYENTVKNVELLKKDKDTAAIFLQGGEIPPAFQKFVQTNLGHTLSQLAEKGRDDFYKGDLAKKIISSLQEKGSLLTEADFASHQGEWGDPLSSTYRDYSIFQVPPNSQGFVGLMILNILENYDLSTIPHGSYQYYHLLVEAIKVSFQDRNKHLTDPNWHNIPLERLLSKEYARKLAASISFEETSHLSTQPVGSDTAHAAVVDSEGNAVSFIQSLYFEFGSGIVAGETGITMQNRGSFFSLDEQHINALEPQKRTFHTLMPAMAFKNDKPYVLYGTQGGEGQPQTQTVMITRMLDYGMNPQEAISGTRFVWGRTWGEKTEELKIESRIPTDVLEKLQKAGHIVNRVEAYDGIMGHANAILIDDQGYLYGGVDPRSDGAAIGK